ncbi:uncharacterized protein DSM5745_08404 [Aspergillus mulundensis]|uniref:Uncharacterized protein n=1 Tax=Aspergillus mulundensis TaxID=1810919 RepID=A0A3D8RA08_9EURO|nr:hypothetical protein DSM5745_08404 [Aspergillus mulundensis]RDW70893.1 hypothetical protein DSM5745_08404 [Aspergillus mulundensis]
MASGATTIDESAFRQALDKFRLKITPDEALDFQLTTVDDLKSAIKDLQAEQMAERKMRNLRRVQNFVLAMEQFEQIISVYLNASEFVGFVWGPMKFILLVASSYAAALDAVLGMYETIGLNLPQLEQYQSLFQANPHMRTILHLIYADILRFHRKALKFFKQRVWKQVFQATWKTLSVRFSRITDSFLLHKSLLESQANLIQFAEYRKFVSEEKENHRRRKDDDDRRKQVAVRDWLQPANTSGDQEKHSEQRLHHPESGKWILSNIHIRAWSDPNVTSTPLLWLTGIPGAGKTILASLLIQKLRTRTPTTCVIFFYFKHGDPERNSFLSMARSLLGQLLRYNKTLLSHLHEKATDSETSTLKSVSEAQDLLALALRSVKGVYIVLDGIDECVAEQSRKVISWARQETELINNDSGDARCFFISQDDQTCNKILRDIPTIKISQEDNLSDIRAYCDALSQSWTKKFDIPATKQKEIVEAIVRNASGMFLFAKLVMHNVGSRISKEDFLKETSSKVLPQGLNEAYGRIVSGVLKDQDESRAKYARKVLGWLVCGKRSLKWHEIQGAISTDIDTRTIDFENRKLSVDSKQLFGSLVEIQDGGEVELVHTTAKFYLLDSGQVAESKEAYGMCRLCLVYLSHPCVDHQLSGESLNKYVLQGYYGFLDYAVAYWVSHLESCLAHTKDYDDRSFESLGRDLQLFLDRHFQEGCRYPVSTKTQIKLRPFKKETYYDRLALAFEYWQQETTIITTKSDGRPVLDLQAAINAIRSELESLWSDQKLPRQIYGGSIFKCSRLYCNFFFEGFGGPTERDLHIKEHERSYTCQFPNCPASQMGYVSRKDLDRHLSNSHHIPELTAEFPIFQDPSSIDIMHACKTGNLAMVERWAAQFRPSELAEKAGLMEESIKSAMGLAVANEHFSVVKLLLEQTSSPADYLPNVIRLACSLNRNSILRSVLDMNIETKPVKGLEKRLGHCVHKLLRRYEDTLARDLLKYLVSNEITPRFSWLETATKVGCLTTIGYLFDTCGNYFPDKGSICIKDAAKFGKLEVCRLLIHHESSRLSIGDIKRALEAAAANGEERIMDLLLQDLPEHEQNGTWFQTAQLRKAAIEGAEETVANLLSDQELQLNIVDREKRTPLYLAVANRHTGIVSLLVSSGRDIGINVECDQTFRERRSIHLKTALCYSAFHGYIDIAKILLQCEGIDITFRGTSRLHCLKAMNAFETAREAGHHDIVDLFTQIEEISQQVEQGYIEGAITEPEDSSEPPAKPDLSGFGHSTNALEDSHNPGKVNFEYLPSTTNIDGRSGGWAQGNGHSYAVDTDIKPFGSEDGGFPKPTPIPDLFASSLDFSALEHPDPLENFDFDTFLDT